MGFHIGFDVPGGTMRQKRLLVAILTLMEKREFRTGSTNDQFGSTVTFERVFPEKRITIKVVVGYHLESGQRTIEVKRSGKVLFEANYWFPAFPQRTTKQCRMSVSVYKPGHWERLLALRAAS